MTNVEFYKAVMENAITNEVIAKAEVQYKKEMARAEKNAELKAEKNAERAERRNALMKVMTTEGQTASTLIELAGLDCHPQAVAVALKPLVEDGTIEKVEVKVDKRKLRGYRLATNED